MAWALDIKVNSWERKKKPPNYSVFVPSKGNHPWSRLPLHQPISASPKPRLHGQSKGPKEKKGQKEGLFIEMVPMEGYGKQKVNRNSSPSTDIKKWAIVAVRTNGIAKQ